METTSLVEVFRTGRSHEVLMVLNELQERGVPVTGQEESGGAVFAMPLTPTHGPDVTWVVRVPELAVVDAKQIISALPLDTEQTPGVFHFGPSRSSGKLFRVMAFVLLLSAGVFLIYDLFRGN